MGNADLMDLLALFGLGLSTGLSGAMIPGPLTLFVVSEAFRRGRLAGVQIAIGHLILEAIFAGFVVFGLREFLSSTGFRTAVVWVGGSGLITMGILILKHARRFSLTQQADVAFQWGPFVGGAFFSLTSPGFLIWWATIGSSVLLQGALRGPEGLFMVAIGHALADLAWCWFVAFSVERGRAYCSDRAYRLVMGLIALCLIGLGLGLVI
jgi:threonine/homoserine/homoserine lactone efflux protein